MPPRIAVRQLGPGVFQLRWREPATGRDIRRRVSGTLHEAHAAAAQFETGLQAQAR